MSAATRIAFDKINRFASKAPALDISSSDPADTATGVPITKTIALTFSTPLHPPSVDNTNITISPNVARTTTLDSVNHRIVTIDPTSNLAAATSYTVTATTGLQGLYGPWKLTSATGDSISFTTA
jgi:Bacterial Ig-like domain